MKKLYGMAKHTRDIKKSGNGNYFENLNEKYKKREKIGCIKGTLGTAFVGGVIIGACKFLENDEKIEEKTNWEKIKSFGKGEKIEEKITLQKICDNFYDFSSK